MENQENKFVDPKTFDYNRFDDDQEFRRCEKCGKYHELSYITGMNLDECDEVQLMGEDVEIPDGKGNKERWKEIVKETHKCPLCPKHDVENRTRREKDNRYKNSRKGK